MSKRNQSSTMRRKMRNCIIPEIKAYSNERIGSNKADERRQKAYADFKRPAYHVKKGEKK